MPNIMIHEKVGNYISNKININSYDYYLGLLAPDTPNLDGFAPKEERWMAHQRRKDYDEWRESLLSFYKREKDNYPKDFILGYYIHVLTDIVYDDFLYLKVREEILKEYDLDKSHDVMRKDMDKYYFKEIENIKELLNSSDKSYDILNISSKKLIAWKEKEMSSWDHPNTSKYITEEITCFLEEQVYNELVNQIEV